MKHTKKIISTITIIFICTFTFFNGYNMVKDGNFSYADETIENWQNVTTNEELVEAFRYYCKSRDLTIEGSLADSVTSFTTFTFNNICNGLGIDITALQAHLKKETDGNGIRFLFDSTGITAYNRIFSQFLQDNEIDVGDTVNKQVYSGLTYIDADGNSCLVGMSSVNNFYYGNGTWTTKGTPLKYSTSDIVDISSSNDSYVRYNLIYWDTSGHSYSDSNSWSVSKRTDHNNTVSISAQGYYNNGVIYSAGYNDYSYYGYVTVLLTSSNELDLVVYSKRSDGAESSRYLYKLKAGNTTVNNSPMLVNTTINITTNNNTVNNNTYEGDTIINNNGTPSEPDIPTPPPSPDYSPAEDWDIQLPDLDIPNWIISGKENKFPFDIPFNVMYALSLLQAEPQAPHLEGTMNFGFTTWQYDLDLSDFDTVAEICRNMEFLAFLTGLMLMTRKLIWG